MSPQGYNPLLAFGLNVFRSGRKRATGTVSSKSAYKEKGSYKEKKKKKRNERKIMYSAKLTTPMHKQINK